VPLGGGGYIVLTKPWPSMMRGIYGDDERYKQTYWSKLPAQVSSPATAAIATKDGDYWFMGRIDDVMNVSGHRISTAEVEHALVDHHDVAEAAVVRPQRRHHGSGDRGVRHAQITRQRHA
jgi:acetyl-CoA synthetase